MQTLQQIVTETPKQPREVELAASVRTKVLALPNLDSDQVERVYEIAFAFAYKNHREPNYEGIANLVRNMPVRPTPNTLAANKGQI
jgi:hypothetical protein